MQIKIVTDSTSDLPANIVKDLGISIVPLYVRFGEDVFRERVDITDDEYYQKLLSGTIHPSTIQPSPQDFQGVYEEVAKEADGIISIHISSKLSGTYNSALQASEAFGKKCPIEVVDSEAVTMGLGLIAMFAATRAKEGANLTELVADTKEVINNIHLLGLLDTLKYLQLGGRIGKAKALLGSILNVKPLVTLREGEVVPAGQARTRVKGIQRLFDFAKEVPGIQDAAIVYNTTPAEAEALAERIDPIFPKKQITLARVGTTLGTHCGPGFVAIALRS